MSNVSKGFIKAILILLILGCVFYTISYSVWKNKGVNEDIDISQYLEEEKKQYEQDVDDAAIRDAAKTAYDMINAKMIQENFGEEFVNIYYANERITIESFSSEFMIYLAVVNLQKSYFMTECNNEVLLSKETVNTKIKELFGNSTQYEDKSFQNKNKTLTIEYDETSSTYKVINTICSGIPFGNSYLETEFYDYSISGNTVEIIEKAYYVSYTVESNGIYLLNYHSGINKETPVIATKELSKQDIEKMQEYKYTFKTGNNNKYYLVGIETIKK